MSKKIIITGTSSGIGFELVNKFAKAGHQVLALSRNNKPVNNLNYNTVSSFSCDLCEPDSYKQISSFIKLDWGTVDVLINNAGILLNKPFEETTLADFELVYRTNVFAVSEMIKTVLPFMNTDSHVVSISSMGGIQGSVKFPGLSAYSSSKAAIITLTELLAEEYKTGGPSFNALALGAVQTEMLAKAFPDYKAPLTAKDMANYIYEFALTGHLFYNGKVLQVSNSTP